MNGALLVARTPMDDAPIKLFPDFDTAHAATFTLNDEDAVVAEMERIMKVDIGSALCALGIIVFENGVPQPIQIVRHYNLDEPVQEAKD